MATVVLCVPPDKSISHRSLIFSSLARGSTRVHNFLFAQDCLSTAGILEALGIKMRLDRKKKTVEVEGKGKFSYAPPKGVLFAGNSGTTMRIMTGVLAGQDFESVLDGDESLRRRPMDRVIRPLSSMGARIESRNGRAPLRILPARLTGIRWESSLASAQVKSAVLLAGLHAEGKTYYREKITSRDHTERMFRLFGRPLRKYKGFLIVDGSWELESPGEIFVPGDISSASFFLAYGALRPGIELVVRQVGVNPTRMGMVEVLRRMGARVRLVDKVDYAEPYADIVVKSTNLRPVRIRSEELPRLIDEVPIIAVLASFAKGKSVIEGVDELRVKESDRVEAIRRNLVSFGVDVRVVERKGRTDLEIRGGKPLVIPKRIRTWKDHRIAMAFGVMMAVLGGDLDRIDDRDCVDISYPEFWETLSRVSEGVDYGC